MTDMAVADPGRRLEQLARESPTLYHVRLALLGALGHGFLILVLLLVAGLLIGLAVALVRLHLPVVALKLALPLLLVAGVVLRALWFRIPEPSGLGLELERVPRLRDVLEDVRRQLHVPRIHRVLLTGDFNAGITQASRFGLLGGSRNCLILGLPLMGALTPDEFRAVLGHELGHVSGNHGAFAAWMYRLRETWSRIGRGLEEQSRGFDLGLRDFLKWYVPKLNAESFPMARAQEYVADACAAEIASRDAACDALIALEVAGRRLREAIWPGLHGRAAELVEPPRSAFHDILREMAAGGLPADERRALALALHRATDDRDTHPSLRDRLRALRPERPLEAWREWSRREHALTVTAAAELLGDELERLTTELDHEWRSEVFQGWGHEHRVIQKQRSDLEALDRAAAERTLTREESWSRVEATLRLREAGVGCELLRAHVQAHPEHLVARFSWGRALLAAGNDAGVAEVDAVMAVDPNAIPPGAELVEQYFVASHRTAEAEAWGARVRSLVERLRIAREERATLRPDDRFGPHTLEAEPLRRLIDFLSDLPLRRVLLARKAVEHFQDIPLWVLGFSARARAGWPRNRADEARILEQLKETLANGADFLFFVIEDAPALTKALEEVEGSSVLSP